MKTIAVLSQFRAGHILAYHRIYAERFAALGWRVLEILPPPSTRWSARLLRQFDRISWLRGRRAWTHAAAQVRAAESATGRTVDAVFLVFLDVGFLGSAVSPAEVDRWFPWRWAGVTNAPSAIQGSVPPYPKRERALAATRCRAVVVTDDAFVAPCQAAWPGKRVVVMPEVADLSPPGQPPRLGELREFARGRRLVGLLGVISAKKNVAAFLAVARRALASRPDLAFFLAGDFTAQACPGPERRALTALLARMPENCRLFPQPIPDGPEFNAWLAACDVAWVAYRDVVHKSNVLTKAAHFEKPVIVSPRHVMAAHTAEFNLGEIVDVDDSAATLRALERLLAPPQKPRNFSEFAALNSIRRMDRTVTDVLAALA